MSKQSIIRNIESNADFEVGSLDTLRHAKQQPSENWVSYIKYFLIGILFGIILVKGEVVSWFRIQEMFRLQSFYMYGVIGSAIVIGIISVQLIKRLNIKTLSGDKIDLPQKRFTKNQIYGGLIFGFGWALTGACPGPIFAQIGAGIFIAVVILVSAIAGTWAYGALKERLPH